VGAYDDRPIFELWISVEVQVQVLFAGSTS